MQTRHSCDELHLHHLLASAAKHLLRLQHILTNNGGTSSTTYDAYNADYTKDDQQIANKNR